MKYSIAIVFVLLIFAGCAQTENIEPQETTGDSDMEEQPNSLPDTPDAPDESIMDESMESEPDVTVSLVGRNFEYEDEQGNVNPTITVQQGDLVRIEYTTESGTHDFVIDEFGATEVVRSDAGVQILEFNADQAGEFEYYCSVGSHRAQGMVGNFVVE